MSTTSQHQLRKEADMRRDFTKLSNVLSHGVKKYSTEYIIAYLAHKYYYSTVTVEKILNGQYERQRRQRNQMS